MRLVFSLIVVCFIAAIAAVFLRPTYVFLEFLAPDKKTKIQAFESTVDATHARLVALSNDPFWGVVTSPQDLSQLMNSKVSWDTGVSILPVRIQQAFEESGKSWENLAKNLRDPIYPEYAWIHRITMNDVWDIGRSPVVQNYLKSGDFNPIKAATDSPIPLFKDVLWIAQWAALDRLKVKDVLGATRVMQNAAHLLSTTENIVGVVLAAKMLEYANEIPGAKTDVGPSAQEIKDFSMVFSKALSPLRSLPRIKQFLGRQKLTPLFCAGIHEAIMMQFITSRLIEPYTDYEEDYREHTALMGDLLNKTQSRCRLTLPRQLWPNRLKFSLGPKSDVPYLRRVIAVPMLMMGF